MSVGIQCSRRPPSQLECHSSSVDRSSTGASLCRGGIRKRLGRNVRRLRDGKELSQEAFAHEAGIHRTYVSDIERGARNPTISIVQRLADALGVEPAELLS